MQITSMQDVYAAAFIGCLAAIFVYQIADRILWRWGFSRPGAEWAWGEVPQGPDHSKAKKCDKCGCIYMPDLGDPGKP
jgi:hypothetical protein